MNIEKQLKEKFTQINKAFLEEESGNDFLRIEVNLKSLDEITLLSREISSYLDEIDQELGEYFLDVYSSGTDTSIEIKDLEKHLEANVLVTLNELIKEYDSFEGTLIEVKDETITIKWNAKGQFRKQEINKNNIKNIKLYAKTK